MIRSIDMEKKGDVPTTNLVQLSEDLVEHVISRIFSFLWNRKDKF